MQTFLDFGIRLVTAMQAWGSWLAAPMKFFSYLGTEDVFMLLLPILYWCVDNLLGLRVAVLLMLSTSLNGTLKLALHAARPYWSTPAVQGLVEETSFGAPSNHAQSAVVVWGTLAAYLKKGWGWLVAVLLMLLIGLSRLYLGVHFPHDAVLGWLIGGLVLWLALRFWQPVAAWAGKQSAGRQVLLAFLASVLLFLLPLIPALWLKATNWQPPQQWAAYAAQAVSLQDAATAAGVLFGMLAGLVWQARLGRFQVKGVWWKLVLRFLLGIAGVLIIRYGLKLFFPEGETALAYFLRFLRYALIGLWVSAGAPWAFIRLKLADKRS